MTEDLEEAQIEPEAGQLDQTEGASDDFSEIRDHFESGQELTDAEMDAIADLAVGYLKGILALFGENDCCIDEYDGENGELILDVNGGDLAVLIGRHGRTLDALQMVLNSLMSSRIKFYYPLVVDIEGYKSRRRKKIESIARSSAARAKERGGKVTLDYVSEGPLELFRELLPIRFRGESHIFQADGQPCCSHKLKNTSLLRILNDTQ